jgi:hypothetical protein
MYDKNLTLSQFNIQLSRNLNPTGITEFCQERIKSLQTESLATSDPSAIQQQWNRRYPKDFFSLRTLIVAHYFIEDPLIRFGIKVDLEELSLRHLNRKQQIELKVLLSSKDICLRYLLKTKRYHSNQIFGAFSEKAAKMAFSKIREYQVSQKPPARKVWRRGYRDGKSIHKLPHQQVTNYALTTEASVAMNRLEQRNLIFQRTTSYLIKHLSEISDES